MQNGGLVSRIRAAVAALFGVSDQAARTGSWWEVDLVLVVLLGSFALGIAAWFRL